MYKQKEADNSGSTAHVGVYTRETLLFGIRYREAAQYTNDHEIRGLHYELKKVLTAIYLMRVCMCFDIECKFRQHIRKKIVKVYIDYTGRFFLSM